MAESNQDIDTQIKRITVVAVAVAGAIAIIEGPGSFDLWSTMTGIVLLMILQVFVLQSDNPTTTEPFPNPYELAVINAVWALCFLITIGFVLDIISNILISLLNLIPNSLQTSPNPPQAGSINQIDNLINMATNILSNVLAFVVWLFIAWKREAITSNPRYHSLFRLFANTKKKKKATAPSGLSSQTIAPSMTTQSSATSAESSLVNTALPTTSQAASQIQQNTSDK